MYSDEGLIAEATQNISLQLDGSVTTNQAPNITTQYGLMPDSNFSTGVLFIKTKNSLGLNTVAYYHHDHLQTPLQATDKAGNIVWSATYNVFGQAIITTPSATELVPTIESNLRLPGQYEDTETGLHYNFNRYYDPQTGRYISQDPIGLAGGINRFSYVNHNPLNKYDPLGLCPLCVGALYGAISGGIGGYISSGNLQGTLLGAGTGALVGAAGGAGFFGGAVASLIGQAAGNLIADKEIFNKCNYDITAILGAGLGGAIGTPLNRLFGRYTPQIRLSEIGRAVGSESVFKTPGLLLGAAVEGIIVGTGEKFGTGLCGCPPK